MKKKLLIGLIAGSAVFAAVFGAAASLGTVGSTSLGAGNTDVSSCDTDGVNTSYAVAFDAAGYKVSTVTVSGIAAGCSGKSLSIQLVDTNGALTGGAANKTVGGTSETLTLTGGPLASSVTGVHVVING
jgi:hypothetical protein